MEVWGPGVIYNYFGSVLQIEKIYVQKLTCDKQETIAVFHG